MQKVGRVSNQSEQRDRVSIAGGRTWVALCFRKKSTGTRGFPALSCGLNYGKGERQRDKSVLRIVSGRMCDWKWTVGMCRYCEREGAKSRVQDAGPINYILQII